ncbi:MAG: subtype B tannase [Muribaculaceae bacterium]
MTKLRFATLLVAVACVYAAQAQKQVPGLAFDASKGVAGSVTMPQGRVVNYTAYTHLYYVTEVEDSVYQCMNVYVPDGADAHTPIFMRNYVGGYMAARASGVNPDDASGRALAEGYVVVIAGARGRNSSTIDASGQKHFNGRSPNALLDLKAAVRYLRHFDDVMPGDAECIITDGTSAGGAMSALLGATGNHPDYEPMLKAMGAAPERDDVFASVCYCPIIDLEHADMAYEWLYGVTNGVTRPLSDEQARVSKLLAADYASYLNSLNLHTADGQLLTPELLREHIKSLLIASAQKAKDAGADMPDSVGLVLSNARPAVPGGMRPQSAHFIGRGSDEYVVDLDLDRYLNYVVTTKALKTPPAFDSQGVAGARPSGENEEFGDEHGSSVNYTPFSLRYATGNSQATISAELQHRVRLINPMCYIADDQATKAQHWWVRHGARDRDTSFPVPVCLALKLQNQGLDVDFFLPWNRGHSGDYALNELFQWIAQVTAQR